MGTRPPVGTSVPGVTGFPGPIGEGEVHAMTASVLLILAVLCQFAAAVLAIRLIRVTGFNRAWIAISLAVLVMLARRGMSGYQMWSEGVLDAPDWTYEGAGLLASLLMFAGVASIGPLLRGMQRTQRTLEKTVIDIAEQRKADERVKRLNAVLHAIRNANQVIARAGSGPVAGRRL